MRSAIRIYFLLFVFIPTALFAAEAGTVHGTAVVVGLEAPRFTMAQTPAVQAPFEYVIDAQGRS
jgi:hypothetical protein